jgi:hypothetical protein
MGRISGLACTAHMEFCAATKYQGDSEQKDYKGRQRPRYIKFRIPH